MTSYNITLKDAEGGLVGSFECPSDTYILDQLEDYFQYMLEFQRKLLQILMERDFSHHNLNN